MINMNWYRCRKCTDAHCTVFIRYFRLKYAVNYTHTHWLTDSTTPFVYTHWSNSGFPPWYTNRVGKVQNLNSFGHNLFSFPLITKQLLTDSQHSQHSHNVFLAFQTCRQTGWEKRGGEERKGRRETFSLWWAGRSLTVCGYLVKSSVFEPNNQKTS